MQVKKNYDVVASDVIDPKKGTDPCDNPGIMASISKVKNTPGEDATNETAALDIKKAQPFGKGGSGYSDKD